MVESMFSTLGLNTPVSRFLFGFGLLGSAMFMAKPSFAFTSSGDMRPWKPISKSADSTYLVWWIPGLLAGAYAGLYI